MEGHPTTIKKRLSDQLPVHTPDQGLWQRISSGLDSLDADKALEAKLGQLPVHTPNEGTWEIIYTRLNRIAYFKTIGKISVAAAACLLLYFGVLRHFVHNTQTLENTPLVTLGQNDSSSDRIKSPVATFIHPIREVAQKQEKSAIQAAASTNSTQATSELLPEDNITANIVNIETEIRQGTSPISSIESQKISNVRSTFHSIQSYSEVHLMAAGNNFKHSFASADVQKSQKASKPLKYYTPEEKKPGQSKNNFALAMNYFPESIYDGTENTLFRNFDITALYNKENVRFNTSLGMAYTEVDMQFDMNYNINIPITAHGTGGQLDTLGFAVSEVQSQYHGSETHRYFIYNLGIGRRIFSVGKFSTWFNAGAGFGIRLNNPDLVSATEKSIKGQYNAVFTSVNSSKPVYNDYNINFITGIDFNYKIINRISISFTPTSRWFFKSIMTKDNQPTDELTLGFKTGMKFDF